MENVITIPKGALILLGAASKRLETAKKEHDLVMGSISASLGIPDGGSVDMATGIVTPAEKPAAAEKPKKE